MPHQAKGYCAGCYHILFFLERIKAGNYKRKYGLDIETYKKITSKCVVCGFDKIVDLHHLDMDKKNRSSDNLIGLCPNHHQMIHSKYREEIFKILENEGYKIQRTIEVRSKLKIFYPNKPTETLVKTEAPNPTNLSEPRN